MCMDAPAFKPGDEQGMRHAVVGRRSAAPGCRPAHPAGPCSRGVRKSSVTSRSRFGQRVRRSARRRGGHFRARWRGSHRHAGRSASSGMRMGPAYARSARHRLSAARRAQRIAEGRGFALDVMGGVEQLVAASCLVKPLALDAACARHRAARIRRPSRRRIRWTACASASSARATGSSPGIVGRDLRHRLRAACCGGVITS